MRFIDYEVTGKIADRINVLELTQAGLPSRDDGVRERNQFGSAIWCEYLECRLQRRSNRWTAFTNGTTIPHTRCLMELAPAGSILVDGQPSLNPDRWGELDEYRVRRVYEFHILDSEGLKIFRDFLKKLAEEKWEALPT